MAMNFADAINQLNSNSNENNFRPTTLGKKQAFFGRILPLENGGFPFVQFREAWVSFTKKDGSVTALPVIIDPSNQNDQLAKLLNTVIQFNKDKGAKDEKGYAVDTIKLASGRFPLSVRTRAYFLGVPVTNQNGTYAQAVDNQGRPAVEAYQISYSGMYAISSLLTPEMPYMNARTGQPMFTDQAQFMTAKETMPVSAKFVDAPNGGVGSWNASVNQAMILPAMNFNYLERDAQGNMKYVDDIEKEAKPLIESDPNFYQIVLKQLTQSYNTQMAQVSSNPYATGASFNSTPQVGASDLPFPNQNQTSTAPANNQAPTTGQPAPQAPMNNQPQAQKVDVVANMTGQPASNFTQSQTQQPTAPAQSAPQAPVSSSAPAQGNFTNPFSEPTTDTPENDLSMPFPNSADMQEPAPTPTSQASVQPTTPAQQPQPQPNTAPDPLANLNASSDVDSFLANLK
jgi:hypothetical protein